MILDDLSLYAAVDPHNMLASDFLSPVARRWKGQISELAEAWGSLNSYQRQAISLMKTNHKTGFWGNCRG